MNLNIETHSHEMPVMIDHHDFTQMSRVHTRQAADSGPLIGNFLIPILKEANGVLSSIPQSTLHDSLQPVVNALKKLDAELLLDLEITDRGPRVMEG
jgi:hypothetical protein